MRDEFPAYPHGVRGECRMGEGITSLKDARNRPAVVGGFDQRSGA